VTARLPDPGRPVSGLERVWLAAEALAPPFVNQCVLTLPAPLSTEALRRAVEQAAGVHPGVCVRPLGRLSRQRWVVDGPPPRVVRVEAPEWDARSERGAPFLHAPLVPGRGPVCEVVHVVGGPAGGEHIVIRTHHAALDGTGTRLFVEDVLRCLDDVSPRGAEAGPVFDLDLARGRAPGPRREPPADAVAPTGAATRGLSGGTWRRVTLPVLPSPVLPRVLAALEAVSAPGRLRIGLPVDLRRYAPGLRASANLTGIAHFEMARPAPAPDVLAAHVAEVAGGPDAPGHVLAADALRRTPLWVMRFAGRLAGASLQRRGLYPVSLSVSNLGRTELTLGGRALAVFWIPPVSPGLPLFVSLTGHAGGLELVSGAPAALADAGRLEAFTAALTAALVGAAAGLSRPGEAPGRWPSSP
jgi:hypothetical protein